MCPELVMRKRRRTSLPGSLFQLAYAMWRLPTRWNKRIQRIGLPRFLDELESEVRSSPPLPVAPAHLLRLVRWRTVISWRWRRNRCLLHGLLLLYLLARAGGRVTLHVGCKSVKGTIRGHCWITSPDLALRAGETPPDDLKEVISKTLVPSAAGPADAAGRQGSLPVMDAP
jgi:hypothetical protein